MWVVFKIRRSVTNVISAIEEPKLAHFNSDTVVLLDKLNSFVKVQMSHVL
jgi:hypothetical protein